MQADAPEAVGLSVLDVSVADVASGGASAQPGQRVRVEATAEICNVTRTATGLAAGDRVRLRYETTAPRANKPLGASPVPVLRKAEERMAYLSKRGEAYEPAAMRYSFETLDLRQSASERLVIRVTGRSIRMGVPGEVASTVGVSARVLEVRATKSGVRAGEDIQLEWAIEPDAPAAPDTGDA
jgi:hypothetical protein